MSLVLSLLLQISSLLTLCVDLARDFETLPVWGRTALVLLSASGLAVMFWPPFGRRIDRRFRPPLALLALGTIVLGGLGLAAEEANRRLRVGWQDGSRVRLERRAGMAEADFTLFLDEFTHPLTGVPKERLEGGAAFDALAEARARFNPASERNGLAIYEADGTLVAWDGNTSRPPEGFLGREGEWPIITVATNEPETRLYALAPTADRTQRWVAEFLLRSPALRGSRDESPNPQFDFLPRWPAIGPANVMLRHSEAEEDDFEHIFEQRDDRLWSRQGRQGAPTLTVPLRTATGQPLAAVTLIDRRAATAVRSVTQTIRRTGALLVAVVLLIVWMVPLSRRAGLRVTVRLAVGSIAVWSIRVVLLLIGGGFDLPDLAVYDITLYASSALGGLIRSPADLLLSALACLAQAWLVRRSIVRIAPPMKSSRRRIHRRAGFTLLGLLAVAGVVAIHELLDQMVLDSRIDIVRVEFGPHLAPRLAIQSALFILVSSLAIVLLALLDYALRCRDEGGRSALWRWFSAGSADRLPLPLRVAAAIFGVTLLYVPFLQHAYDRLRGEFLENELLPRVLYQGARRSEILDEALRLAAEPEFQAAARFAAEEVDETRSAVAYRLWRRSPLGRTGLASSLRLYDNDGNLLSGFAVDVAPMLEIDFDAAVEHADKTPRRRPPPPGVTVRKPLIFGARWIGASRRASILLVMAVVDDYDNIPMMSSGSHDLPFFEADLPARTNPELLRFEPLVAVFDEGSRRVYESEDVIPGPTPEILDRLGNRRPAWTDGSIGDHQARIVYFGDPGGVVYALTHPLPGFAGRVAAFMRLFLLNVVIAVAAAIAIWIGRALRAGEIPRPSLGTTFYGRLTAIYLLSAMIPLLTLAYFVTRYSAREFERERTAAGLRSLQTARRVVADYMAVSVSDESPYLDDDIIFWLSGVVRQDMSVFRDGRLLATSNPELYALKILNRRLDGRVFRSISLDGESYRFSRSYAGGIETSSLSAPMPIDRVGTTGVVSIPLDANSRSVALRTEAVRDAILISSGFTVLLLAAVGWLVARRVSQPIEMLAGAARRMRDGDLDVRVESTAQNEIGTLVESFNLMADALRTQREDLQRRKDYIEKILASATTGVMSLDAGGALITINPAAQRLLGGAARPPGGELTANLATDSTLTPLRDALVRALGGGRDSEVEIVLAQGDAERRLRAVFLRFAPEAGVPAGLIVLLEDVTEIVRAGRLAAWAEMARRIAHEVKNPLTPIQLSVEHVRRVWNARDDRFDPILRECLDNIQHQVKMLRQIATEFSDYARLPQLRPRSIEVSQLVSDALRPYAIAPPPGIEFRSSVPDNLPPLFVDPTVVLRTLVNLIENALQALEHGGTVSIAVSLDNGPGAPRRMRLEVHDTGAGIDPAIRSRMFEPYFSTRSGGTGLGLAIARKAVEEHGGAIDIRSRPGKGTTVILHLPLAGPPDAGGAR